MPSVSTPIEVRNSAARTFCGNSTLCSKGERENVVQVDPTACSTMSGSQVCDVACKEIILASKILLAIECLALCVIALYHDPLLFFSMMHVFVFCLPLLLPSKGVKRQLPFQVVDLRGLAKIQDVHYAFAVFSPDRAVSWLRNKWRGLRTRDFLWLSHHMTMPHPLEDAFRRIAQSRAIHKAKTVRANRLPDGEFLERYDGFEVREGNYEYNKFWLRELTRGKVSEVRLLGTTRSGDRVWNFPIYCDRHVFRRFLQEVSRSPHDWRDLFLYGILRRNQLYKAFFLFDRALCDLDAMTSDFSLLRIGGAVLGLVNAYKKKDHVAFASIVATMSDVLGEFVKSERISSLTDFGQYFSTLLRTDVRDEDDTGLEVDESGNFVAMLSPDITEKGVYASPQYKAIARLCANVAASTFFKSTYFGSIILESVDWENIYSQTSLAACVAASMKEIVSGLQAVFAAEGDWLTRASKFFKPPPWVTAMDRGDVLIRPPNKVMTKEEIASRINEITEVLNSVKYEINPELTPMKNKLREARYQLQLKYDEKTDRTIPMMIWLSGFPGVGKTTLIQGLIDLLNVKDNHQSAYGDVINVNVHDKFPASTGINPHARFVVLNDVPAEYTDFPQQDKAPLDLLIQQMIDSNVFYFRGAAIEDKGVALANIRYVIITSNFRSFKMVDDTLKLKRRFEHAACYHIDFNDPIVKDQTDLSCKRLEVVTNNKHLKFEPTQVVFDRLGMIRDILSRKESYDLIEAERLMKFGENAVRCRCGASKPHHYVKREYSKIIPDVCYADDEWPSKVPLQGNFFRAVGSSVLVSSVAAFSAVLLEEVVKSILCRFTPSMTIYFFRINFGVIVASLFENFLYSSLSGHFDSRTFSARLLVTAMHLSTTNFPLFYACLMHFIWNNFHEEPGDFRFVKHFALSLLSFPFVMMYEYVRWFGSTCFVPILEYIYKDFDTHDLKFKIPFYLFWFFGFFFANTWDLIKFLFARYIPLPKLDWFFRRWERWKFMKELSAFYPAIDNPLTHLFFLQTFESCVALREWCKDHAVEIAAFTVVAFLAYMAVKGSSTTEEMQGATASIFADGVDPKSLRVPVVRTEQVIPNLASNRVWSHRNDPPYKLVRDAMGVSENDLATMVKDATVHCVFKRSFADGKCDQVSGARVFFLGPEIVCFNRHYLYRKSDMAWANTISLTIEGSEMCYDFVDVIQDDETEIVFVRNAFSGLRAPLTKFLPKEDTVRSSPAAIFIDDRVISGIAAHYNFTEPNTKSVYRVWTVPGEATFGDCASPMISTGKDSCILGLVCSISTSAWFNVSYVNCARLNQQIVSRVLSKFSAPVVGQVSMTWLANFEEAETLSDKSEFRNVPSPFLAYIGTTTKPTRRFTSKLRKTIMHDDVSPLCNKQFAIPTAIRGLTSEGEWSSAVITTFKNMNMTDTSTFGLKRAAMLAYLKDCLANTKGVKLNALDLSQAIFGWPDIGVERVPFKTSCGPTLRERSIANKYDLFTKNSEGLYVFNEDVRSDVEALLKKSTEGIVDPIRVDFTPKDEVREASKLEKYKIRLFSVVDFVYNITLRMLVMPLLSLLLNNRFDSAIMGQMNAGSPEWGELAKWLTGPGGKVFDIDFSAFDTSHNTAMLKVAAEFFYHLSKEVGYDYQYSVALYCLLVSLTLQIVAYMSDIIFKIKGLPSGVIVTLVVNSIINSILLRMAFMMLVPDVPVSDFRKYVHEATVGDDNVVGVADSIADRFNAATIFPLYARWGYIATPAVKNALVVPYMSIYDVTFLKRRFRFDKDSNMWFAPIEVDSIWKALCFQRQDAEITPTERLSQVGENAQREFFLHGRDVFERQQVFLRDLYAKHNVPLTLLSYEALFTQYVNKEFRTEDI